MATGEQFFYVNNRIIDVRGLAVGAQIYFYLTGTTTLSTVYSDAALTTPIANPYTVNAGAAIPNIYLNPDITYRVRIVATTGQVIDDLDPFSSLSSSGVSFLQVGTGAVTRTMQAKARDIISVKDFGAKGDDETDDTAAIQAAINYLNQNLISGALYFPKGIYRVTALTITYVVAAPLRLYGDGILSSIVRKIGASTTPVLTMTGTGLLDVYAEISNISFDGQNVATAGIKITDCARVYMHRVGADKSTVGIDGRGFLTSRLMNCRTDDNEIGVRTRAGSVFSNLLVISQHEARSNSVWGMDLGQGESLQIESCELAGNGTTANTNTGGMVLRSTLASEAGLGSVVLVNNYFEINKGNGLLVEAATSLSLDMNGNGFYTTEAGRAVTIGAIRSVTMFNTKAGGATDVVSINAANSVVAGGVAYTLTDTSTHRVHLGASTSGAHFAVETNEMQGFGSTGNELLISDDAMVSGGLAADTTLYKRGGRLRFGFPTGSFPFQLEQSKVGFFQAAPVAKQTVSGAATDAASTQTLANSLRALLIAYGLAA